MRKFASFAAHLHRHVICLANHAGVRVKSFPILRKPCFRPPLTLTVFVHVHTIVHSGRRAASEQHAAREVIVMAKIVQAVAKYGPRIELKLRTYPNYFGVSQLAGVLREQAPGLHNQDWLFG